MNALRPGLWRWTTRHPEWVAGAEPGTAADWPPDVGSVAYAAPEAFVLVDPLVEEETWPELDAQVSAHGKPLWVLQTIRWHDRSVHEAAARYSASLGGVPRGVEAIPIQGADETMFWIAEHRALVPGDRLLGDRDGGLRLCPDTWLAYIERETGTRLTQAELGRALQPLLDLPVELVLVSHGDPVLSDGRDAVARALGHLAT